MSRLAQIRMAGMMMTRLPMGRVDPAPSLADSAWAFPLWGLAPGVLGWAAFASAGGALGGLLAVLVAVLVTGALHHDGLADFCDGIGGGADRARALEIMRDSRIGSYGVLALVLVTGLTALAIPRAAPGLAEFLLLGVASRLAMLVAMNRMPPARKDGLGHLAGGQAAIWPSAGLVVLLALWVGGGELLVLGVGALVALGLARLALRRIGGQTGDVLGAIQLGSETAGWVALATLAG